MKTFLRFLQKNFVLIPLFGIIAGLIFGDLIEMNKYLMTVSLMLLMFLSALKVDISSLPKSFKKPFWIINLSFLKLIIAPLIVFAISLLLPFEYRPALILLAGAPAAVAGPGIISLFNGDVKLGLMVTSITNLLVPVILPFILFITVGSNIPIDILSIFYFLLFIILIPFMAAFLVQKYTDEKILSDINEISGGIISIIVFLFMILVIGPNKETMLDDISGTIFSLIIVFGLSLFLHLIAFLFTLKAKKPIIITSVISMAYSNTGLAIVLAAAYFDPLTVLLTVFYEVPWGLMFIPLKRFLQK